MNSHVQRYYRKIGETGTVSRFYHEVIALQDSPHLSWDDVYKMAPSLPKGWYELSQLKSADRIEFTRDFWLATLPFSPHIDELLQHFFCELDDVGIFLIQLDADSAFECEMVYSFADDSRFYRGFPPTSSEAIEQLKIDFNQVLPEDYLSFLRIHDGFCMNGDIGILSTRRLHEVKTQLAEELEVSIDPTGLIPFYKSSDKPCYQCFFAQWAPLGQAGNVFCSAEKMISDILDKNSWVENLAFPTFLDWLIYYLERVE